MTGTRAVTAGAGLMKSRIPLSTVKEVRSELFPATNHARAPGMHAKSRQPVSLKPSVLEFQDGTYVLVSGNRIERHRRILDYLLGVEESKRVPVGNDESAFFIDLRHAANAIFGNGSLVKRLSEAILTMRQITLDYYDAGASPELDVPISASSLVTGFVREYKTGDSILDGCVSVSRYSQADLLGRAIVRVSGNYMRHLMTGLTLRYHTALPMLFRMGPLAAQLARHVLSHQRLLSAPLRPLLAKIGGPSGSAEDRAVTSLRSGPDSVLLAKLGIHFRLADGTRQVVVDFRPQGQKHTMAIVQRLRNGRVPTA